MSTDPFVTERRTHAVFEQALLTCRIIAGALVFGVATFAAAAVVIRRGEAPADGALVSWIAVGVAAAAVIARQVLLGVIGGRTGASQGAGAAGPLALYQTRMIVGLAVLEGAALFNVVAYLLEGRWWSLAVAAGLVGLMLASYPTRGRLARWVADREQLKTFGQETIA